MCLRSSKADTVHIFQVWVPRFNHIWGRRCASATQRTCWASHFHGLRSRYAIPETGGVSQGTRGTWLYGHAQRLARRPTPTQGPAWPHLVLPWWLRLQAGLHPCARCCIAILDSLPSSFSLFSPVLLTQLWTAVFYGRLRRSAACIPGLILPWGRASTSCPCRIDAPLLLPPLFM